MDWNKSHFFVLTGAGATVTDKVIPNPIHIKLFKNKTGVHQELGSINFLKSGIKILDLGAE